MAAWSDVPNKVKLWGGALIVVAGLAALIGWKADRPVWSSELVAARAEMHGELAKVKTQVAGFERSYREGQRNSSCRQISIQVMLVENRHERLMDKYRRIRASGKPASSALLNNISRARRQLRRLGDQQRKRC